MFLYDSCNSGCGTILVFLATPAADTDRPVNYPVSADRQSTLAGDAMTTFGGFAFAREYDIERKWREIRLYRTAPVSTNMILGYVGQHVLGMPRSY